MPSHPYSREISKMDRARSVAQHSVRNHLTYEQKLEVIDFYHQHQFRLPLCKMVEPLRKRGFSTLHPTTIRRLVNNEDRIRRYVSEHPNLLGFKHRSKVTHQQVEEALARWVEQKLNNNIRLTGFVLIEKARQFCDFFGIPEENRIQFSNGWLDGFKRRHALHRVTFHGERASAPAETIHAERLRLQPILAQYHPRDRYNMDETALYGSLVTTLYYLRCELALMSVEGLGLGRDDTGGLKPIRDRLTVALCGNEEGSHKLPLLFIGRAKNPACFPRYQPPREMGYWYFNNKSAWMNYEVFDEFIASLNESMQLQNRHILLLCDNASSHKKHIDKYRALYTHVRIEFLSPNLTPWVQPLDAGIIKSFKSQYNHRFAKLYARRSDEGHPCPYKLNQREVMEIATAAWESVSASTIRNCWRHTGISIPLPHEPLAEPAFVYYPQADAASTAANVALEFGLLPEYTGPAIYDMLEGLALEHPTEEDLSVEQIYEEMQMHLPEFH